MKQNSILLLIFLILCFGCEKYNDPQDPLIVICFDDNYQSVYNNGLPILNNYNMKATNFVNTGRFGDDESYGWDELIELELVHGWESAGHTLNHINMPFCDNEYVEYQIKEDWLNLKNNGLSHESFALPAGNVTVEQIRIIQKYYKNIRNSYDIKQFSPIDETALGYYSFDSSFEPEDMIGRIFRGVDHKEVLIILGFHSVDDENGFSANCTPAQFEEIISWISENGFEVVTLKEAVKRLTE
jgi:peptidoglycan/xylan/chitin deacetylase (PgdA/CDA1 family)